MCGRGCCGGGEVERAVNLGFWLVGFQVAKPLLNMNSVSGPGTTDCWETRESCKESPQGLSLLIFSTSCHPVWLTVGLLVFSRRNMCLCVQPKSWG